MRDPFAIDLNDGHILWVMTHVDDAGHRVLIDARDLGYRMIFQRTEDVADGDVHLARRLDVLENDHAALLENVIDLPAYGFVVQYLLRHARDASAKRKVFA